jgi:hypothetical protein
MLSYILLRETQRKAGLIGKRSADSPSAAFAVWGLPRWHSLIMWGAEVLASWHAGIPWFNRLKFVTTCKPTGQKHVQLQ